MLYFAYSHVDCKKIHLQSSSEFIEFPETIDSEPTETTTTATETVDTVFTLIETFFTTSTAQIDSSRRLVLETMGTKAIIPSGIANSEQKNEIQGLMNVVLIFIMIVLGFLLCSIGCMMILSFVRSRKSNLDNSNRIERNVNNDITFEEIQSSTLERSNMLVERSTNIF
jgi:hypothetical protein